MTDIHWTRHAAANFERAALWLATKDIRAAQKLVDDVDRAILLLAEHPSAAKESDVPGVRVLTLRRLPWSIYYRFDERSVVILAVRHQARTSP